MIIITHRDDNSVKSGYRGNAIVRMTTDGN